MRGDKKEVIIALSTNVREIQKGIEMQCGLLAALLEEQADADKLKAHLELCPGFSREKVLRDAIKEAIEVIESTRRSFKSKRLEALRKRLTRVLIDTN